MVTRPVEFVPTLTRGLLPSGLLHVPVVSSSITYYSTPKLEVGDTNVLQDLAILVWDVQKERQRKLISFYFSEVYTKVHEAESFCQKFPTLYGTQIYITMFTRAGHWALS
jgi:hypothetical protein